MMHSKKWLINNYDIFINFCNSQTKGHTVLLIQTVYCWTKDM